MHLVKMAITSICLLLISTAFSQEVTQGYLKNGIRYYFFPNHEQKSITLAVKTPELMTHFPVTELSDFFISDIFTDSFAVQRDDYFYINGYCKKLEEGLNRFSTCLKTEQLPPEIIRNLRDEYSEDRMDIREDYLFELQTLYDSDLKYTDSLFESDDHAISKAFHGFFAPSRMALIISGTFYPDELEKELECLFGEIPEDEFFKVPHTFKPIQTVIFSGTIDGVESLMGKPIYAHLYKINPQYKEQTLNDLFLLIESRSERFLGPSDVGQLKPFNVFLSLDKGYAYEINPVDFELAKNELRELYQIELPMFWEMCVDHFYAGISDPLWLDNQSLSEALETVTFNDYQEFIHKKFKSGFDYHDLIK